ncbi:hypothetical protein C1H69_18925 [Billgrantia endophytica]|uniref:Uncharacterized protein n=2 Tax=Billgrantia endophytica TaxID=2033802 RepID=A0A2N7TXX5_9GAMM|nr:hypothetical protein C1H69_18925 [Halomonas endophytica]
MKLANGLATRQGADIICLNSKKDLSYAKEFFSDLGLDGSVLESTNYPFAAEGERKEVKTKPNTGRHIVFTTQPHWPGKIEERLYVLGELVKAAKLYPSDKIIIKLRMPAGKKTIHPEKYHYESIFPKLRLKKPTNLEFVYGDMAKVLESTDLHITLASTAAVESIAMKIPTAIIGDFGIVEKYGVDHFVGSGLILKISDALSSGVSLPHAQWLNYNGLGEDDNFEAAFSKLRRVIEKQDQSASALPLNPVYYNSKNYAYDFSPSVMIDKKERLPKRPRLKVRIKNMLKELLPPIVYDGLGAALRKLRSSFS